jgi:hypothetical protein
MLPSILNTISSALSFSIRQKNDPGRIESYDGFMGISVLFFSMTRNLIIL